jgi:hypothetical protein
VVGSGWSRGETPGLTLVIPVPGSYGHDGMPTDKRVSEFRLSVCLEEGLRHACQEDR